MKLLLGLLICLSLAVSANAAVRLSMQTAERNTIYHARMEFLHTPSVTDWKYDGKCKRRSTVVIDCKYTLYIGKKAEKHIARTEPGKYLKFRTIRFK